MGHEATVVSSCSCPEAGACLPSQGEEQREHFCIQTPETQRCRISLLAPRQALHSLSPRPPPREVFSLCILTPQPCGVRNGSFGAWAGWPTPPGARGAHLESAVLGTACLQPVEGEQRQTSYFLGSQILLAQRKVVFTRARRASLHIPGSGSLQDAGAAALAGEKKRKSPLVSSNAGQRFAAQSRHWRADLKRFWG